MPCTEKNLHTCDLNEEYAVDVRDEMRLELQRSSIFKFAAVEGISMPHYSGSLGGSLELFLDQAMLFRLRTSTTRMRVISSMCWP
ncbi:hypothetical protein PHMEG_0004546 [Phytophthora megakarya]|uniref:Uncharacterized protein n=1 Tax=Phytophthora megakarya TaxID=4795 RepID=A0A225WTJ9_9STRA|nr:hypothetical protein PHMEG_0004546 [Phytophthora megakarya]